MGVILAGWASNNKWAVYGAMREACQMVSYAIPLGLSIVVAVMAAAICPALPPATTIATGNATTWKASPSQLSTCPVSTAVMRVVIAPVSSMWDGR